MVEFHDKFLIDSFANMFIRWSSKKFIKKIPNIKFEDLPPFDSEEHEIIHQVSKLVNLCQAANFNMKMNRIKDIVNIGNSYLSRKEFWTIK